jgi:hypothetical protein
MGERAKNIGDEAENKICSLLNYLGYQFKDTNVEGYGIDAIVESPQDSPKVGLARPRYSPNGIVAIEIKEPRVTTEKVDTFRKKILKYNRENSKKLSGGIYIADHTISPKMMGYMKRRRIWGWGQKRLRLYSEKAAIFKTWFKKYFTAEIPIGNHTSFIRVSTLTAKQTLRLSVFFDDETRKLSPSLLNDIMWRIKKKSLSPLIDAGIRPLNVYFEFYSIGGLGKSLREETYKTVALPWKDEGIIVLIDRDSFRDYRTFPTV